MEKYRRRKNFYGVQVVTHASENGELAGIIKPRHHSVTYSLQSKNDADAAESMVAFVRTDIHHIIPMFGEAVVSFSNFNKKLGRAVVISEDKSLNEHVVREYSLCRMDEPFRQREEGGAR